MNNLPTISEFLLWKSPTNSYVRHPGFKSLYVRSSKVFVKIKDQGRYWCHPILKIGSADVSIPGNGAFTLLVEFLLKRSLAIYIENVHNLRFGRKLLKMGFISVNQDCGNHFLFNYEDHLLSVD